MYFHYLIDKNKKDDVISRSCKYIQKLLMTLRISNTEIGKLYSCLKLDIYGKREYPETFLRSHYRSSRPEVFCKKGVLRNLAKFTEKHLCQSLFFSCRRPATLLKKRPWHRRFPVNFVKFLRTHFIIEHVWWLLL